VIATALWTERARAHAARVGPWADAMVDRRSRGTTHPVHDFMFTYYTFAPTRLKQWVPGLGERIAVDAAVLAEFAWLCDHRYGAMGEGGFELNAGLIDSRLRGTAAFVAELCGNVLLRAPRLRCFGLHEWAMVYGCSVDEVRHSGYRLRLPPAELAAFVASQSVGCSHYDAFRFFTASARPLNTLQPDLGSRLQNEQGGCLHANMDLYKWATKLWPWSGSDLIGRAFSLAMEGRDLDMRASPYDLSDLGYVPVCIETEAGRKQYQLEQQRLAELAIPLRESLRDLALRVAAV
jgi:hypothetical protein